MFVYTYTHTHIVAVLAELMATQSREQPKTWLNISVYVNWLSIGPSQTGSEVVGTGIPGVKMAGVEAARCDSAVGDDEAPASCSGRANEASHGIKSIAASLIFVQHLITRNGTGATAGSIRHKPTVDYKPVKMCRYICCCCWLDSNMLIILPSNHFFVFGSILPSVQMRGFVCKLAKFTLFPGCNEISFS